MKMLGKDMKILEPDVLNDKKDKIGKRLYRFIIWIKG